MTPTRRLPHSGLDLTGSRALAANPQPTDARLGEPAASDGEVRRG